MVEVTVASLQVVRCIALEEKIAELDREIACDQRYIERVSRRGIAVLCGVVYDDTY